jgi:hypothetical protein
MKTIKDKQLLVGADFAGYPLKEAVCEYLRGKGWTITDIGVKADSDPDDTDLMFHRVGLRIGSMIAEGEFETHKYLNAVKGGNDDTFRAEYETFAAKYNLAQ